MYIGIVGRIHSEEHGYYAFNQEVIQVIRDYGYLPMPILFDIHIDSTIELERQKPLIDQCCGFLLQGGSMYDEVELLLVQYLHENNIPVLGICLGMQTMAMAFGGMMGHISSHMKKGYAHSVAIQPDTQLFSILEQESIVVNSRHVDYIISTDLTTSAKVDIIEAVEDREKPFFIGVQWHPESLRDENSEKLFIHFFENAKKMKKSKKSTCQRENKLI